MRHLLKPTRRALRRVLIALIVVVAAVNAAAFALTPLLDRYRDDLAALASERLGTPVTVGILAARWRGFGPELVVRDLRIGGGTDEGIQLGEAVVDIGVWDMIRHLDLSPLRITLRGLQLHLVRQKDGRVELTGFEGDPVRGGGTDLPLAGRLRLEDVTLLWEDRRVGLPVQRFENARLRLHLWPDRVTLTASLTLPGERPGRLRAGADLDLAADDWAGEIYLAGHAPQLAALAGAYLPAPMRLASGGADFEFWSDWTASRLSHAEGRVSVHGVALHQGTPAASPLTLDEFAAEFRYRREGEDRQLDLARISLSREGHHWPVSDLHLAANIAGPGWPRLRLSAEYLNLGDLVALSGPWRLPDDLQAMRAGLHPAGELHDLRLELNGGEGPPRWQLSTRFDGLRNHAWGEFPGVAGISGTAQGDQRQVILKVATTGSALDWPTLFRGPVPVDYLAGELTWQAREDGGHELSSRALILDTPDIRSVSRLRLSLPADGPADIDLHSELRDGDGRHTGRYLPTAHLSPEVIAWLDRAITSGRVPQGTLLLRGPLEDFPFDRTRNGSFSVRFDVTDLSLDYQEGWPPLRVDDAQVHFHNNSLAINLRRGRIYGSQVLSADARIENLDPTTSPLLLKGQVDGPLGDLLRLLTETPLKARFGDLASGVQADGKAQLTLDMALALEDQQQSRLQGSVNVRDGKLALAGSPLPLTDVSGELRFNLDGVSAKGLQGTLEGQKVRIDVHPGDKTHRIDARGRVAMAPLQRHLPALPAGLASGETELTVRLDIPNQRKPGQGMPLRIESDLKGVALALPAPLGKSAEEPRPTVLQVTVGDQRPASRLSYGALLDALFKPGSDRAAIRLGGEAAVWPEQPVLLIDGRQEHLDLDPWLALGKQQGGAAAAWPPIRARLDLGLLKLGRVRVEDVNLVVDQQPDGWQGSARAPLFAGRFLVSEGVPLKVDLSRLAIELHRDDADQASPDVGRPADWPEMDLAIESLLINGHDFGRLAVTARHEQEALKLAPLTLSGPLAKFDGMALWRGEGAHADSDLLGTLSAPKLGELLGALGYSPQFEGAPTRAELTLGWPGGLGSASLATLRGGIDLDVGQGRLLEVNPGVTRVFGLFNFNALQRRLRLDFSDLFGKGTAFDHIRGGFRLIDGNAYTQDLTFDGPSAKILISGRTGLVERDLYQEVTLTPRFDATLPVAGALAGGPVTGIAVLLAQQVMKDRVDKFNRIRYSVTGSWDDPKVERVAGGSGLSLIFGPVSDLFGNTPSQEDAEAQRPESGH